MQHWVSLIDKAAEKAGNQAKLAREIGVTRAYITLLRNQERPMTPELAGLIADVAGADVRANVARALFETLERTERGKKVRSAIERSFLAGVAVIFGIFATLTTMPIPSWASQPLVNKIYIVSRQVRTWVFRLAQGVRAAIMGPAAPSPCPHGRR